MKNENMRTGTGNSENSSLNTWDISFGQGLSAFSAQRVLVAGSNKLAALKARLTSELAAEAAGMLSAQAVKFAVNEADSLASTTPFPALFLPALAEEKVQNALAWQARQQAIREHTLAFAA